MLGLSWPEEGRFIQTGQLFHAEKKPRKTTTTPDTATDLVLGKAMAWQSEVILSTPCCQHELNSQMRCDALSFITDHSILKQKLTTAATDALRALMLEINGYKVTVCELIDPEETPKNVIIRAVKTKRTGGVQQKIAQYTSACELLGVEPKLAKLLPLPSAKTVK